MVQIGPRPAEILLEKQNFANRVAVVGGRLGQTTALNLFSIALSIVVLASKGYVVVCRVQSAR